MGDLIGAALVISMAGGWLTHVYTCIVEQAWGLLIAGAIFFPVGSIHGIGVWFGVW